LAGSPGFFTGNTPKPRSCVKNEPAAINPVIVGLQLTLLISDVIIKGLQRREVRHIVAGLVGLCIERVCALSGLELRISAGVAYRRRRWPGCSPCARSSSEPSPGSADHAASAKTTGAFSRPPPPTSSSS
jgi:hypothetical protein